MMRTWPGQTYEEWLKERERNDALTPEERDREMKEYINAANERKERYRAEREKNQPKTESIEEQFKKYDHPNSLENSEATIVWIVVMAIATIFKGNWIIWIVATIIWLRYITRHKQRK